MCVSEKAMATHSSTLAWKIPWAEEPGRLPSVGLHRIGYNWSNLATAAAAVCVCHRFCILNNPSKVQHKYISDKSITVNTIFCFFNGTVKVNLKIVSPHQWHEHYIQLKRHLQSIYLSILLPSIYAYIYIKREKKVLTRGK